MSVCYCPRGESSIRAWLAAVMFTCTNSGLLAGSCEGHSMLCCDDAGGRFEAGPEGPLQNGPGLVQQRSQSRSGSHEGSPLPALPWRKPLLSICSVPNCAQASQPRTMQCGHQLRGLSSYNDLMWPPVQRIMQETQLQHNMIDMRPSTRTCSCTACSICTVPADQNTKFASRPFTQTAAYNRSCEVATAPSSISGAD